jgi:hypothetical protein
MTDNVNVYNIEDVLFYFKNYHSIAGMVDLMENLLYLCSINFYLLIIIYPVIHQNQKTEMKKNMGSADKAIRLGIALVIVILAYTNVISGILAWVLIILAAVFVLTSIFGMCPLYLPFGINTGKKK